MQLLTSCRMQCMCFTERGTTESRFVELTCRNQDFSQR